MLDRAALRNTFLNYTPSIVIFIEKGKEVAPPYRALKKICPPYMYNLHILTYLTLFPLKGNISTLGGNPQDSC